MRGTAPGALGDSCRPPAGAELEQQLRARVEGEVIAAAARVVVFAGFALVRPLNQRAPGVGSQTLEDRGQLPGGDRQRDLRAIVGTPAEVVHQAEVLGELPGKPPGGVEVPAVDCYPDVSEAAQMLNQEPIDGVSLLARERGGRMVHGVSFRSGTERATGNAAVKTPRRYRLSRIAASSSVPAPGRSRAAGALLIRVCAANVGGPETRRKARDRT